MTNLATQRQTAKAKVLPKGKNTALTVEHQIVSNYFAFLRRTPNSEYQNGLKTVPLRSCLLHNKSAAPDDVITGKKPRNTSAASAPVWIVKTQPKWYTDLLKTQYDANTGEILGTSVYRTDCLTSGNNRKIKAVNAFSKHFKSLYQQNKVSLLFYTFTIANEAKISISECMSAFKKRLKRRGINLQGYVWILEVSDNLHVHYHALVAIDRIKIRGKKMPDYLILDYVWGARCQVQFVKNSVSRYLAKYFVKAKNRIVGKRQFGIKMPKA